MALTKQRSRQLRQNANKQLRRLCDQLGFLMGMYARSDDNIVARLADPPLEWVQEYVEPMTCPNFRVGGFEPPALSGPEIESVGSKHSRGDYYAPRHAAVSIKIGSDDGMRHPWVGERAATGVPTAAVPLEAIGRIGEFLTGSWPQSPVRPHNPSFVFVTPINHNMWSSDYDGYRGGILVSAAPDYDPAACCSCSARPIVEVWVTFTAVDVTPWLRLARSEEDDPGREARRGVMAAWERLMNTLAELGG